MSIIEVKRLTKIFGQDPQRGLKLLRSGWPKERIYKESDDHHPKNVISE